ALEQLARAAANRGIQPAIAAPERPIEAALIEVRGGSHQTAFHLHVRGYGRRQKCRVEHLKRHSGRCDANTSDVTDIALRPAACQNAEGGTQVGLYRLKIHSLPVSQNGSCKPRLARDLMPVSMATQPHRPQEPELSRIGHPSHVRYWVIVFAVTLSI